MNSYPPELLAQLAPVMFVAGLDVPKSQEPSETAPTSPGLQAQAPQQLDPFQILSIRLRDALLAQRKPAIWAPEKNKTFHVLLVSPDVLFPPRKLVSPEDPAFSSSHSPLSPLTPSSPLYPDGLIAPIWIRKHTTLVPSVFVMFMRIFELPHNVVRSPLEGTGGLEGEKERAEEERRRDVELAKEIANRKRGTSERGVKLTVVLMASRRLLDDPSLDARLTFIRRQSGLDSRAALFVLSPVSSSELHDFVRSLQQALYDPALEYYIAHSKRVRRKRNRHSQTTVTSYPNPAAASLANPNIARPLRPEGWTVRYEYKMACFAEFRGEDEVALKHYQDAYATLTIMFGSTAILPPRTKRWAEAKVLADCVNIKIVKLYLYNNEHALALSHHNTHIRQFGDFSRGWGIGEETYEFWSWVARQYRVLAELIDQGTRAGLTLSAHEPHPSTAPKPAGTGLLPEIDAMARSAGINPSHALQHSGFYYYMAAKCTDARRARFLAALEAESNGQPVSIAPGFSNEKKVDHLALVLELYTKAYEQFKRHSTPTTITSVSSSNPPANAAPGRLTLYIAYRIAEIHAESGKFDMAAKFFERIAKTYRNEGEGGWDALLKPLLEAWYKCAQRMGDVEGSVKLLIEMMGQDLAESEDPNALEEDLLAVFQSTVPSSTDEPLLVDPPGAKPMFETDVVFWKDEVNVDEAAPFQLLITAPKQTVISSLPFTTVEITFEHINEPIVLRHQDPDEGRKATKVTRVDIGIIDLEGEINGGESSQPKEIETNLRWPCGGTLVCTGAMVSSGVCTLGVKAVVFNIESNNWRVRVPVKPRLSAGSSSEPRWLRSVDPSQFIAVKRANRERTLVKPQPHRFNVSIVHQKPAFLDEDYPIIIAVVNRDDRELEVIADILLQPTDIDYAVNTISVNGEASAGLIKDVPFGILAPGVQATKTLHLMNTGSGGSRLLDISISASSPQPRGEATPESPSGRGEEVQEPGSPDQDVHRTVYQETITIPTVAPFAVENDVAYARTRGEWVGLADMGAFEDDCFDQRKGSETSINVKLEFTGPWSVRIDGIKLETPDTPEIKVVDSSIDLAEGSSFPAEFISGDEFCMSCRALIGIKDDGKGDEYLFPDPGRFIIEWRRILKDGAFGSTSTTIVPLPPLSPPNDTIVALFDISPGAKLHVPLPLTVLLRNYHPTRSANITVQLEPDTSDGFIVAGLRSGRVPVLLPGAEEKLQWMLIPLECGYLNIPKIRILDRRRAIPAPSGGEDTLQEGHVGESVQIVDLRRDARRQERVQSEGVTAEGRDGEATIAESGSNLGSVLVLP